MFGFILTLLVVGLVVFLLFARIHSKGFSFVVAVAVVMVMAILLAFVSEIPAQYLPSFLGFRWLEVERISLDNAKVLEGYNDRKICYIFSPAIGSGAVYSPQNETEIICSQQDKAFLVEFKLVCRHPNWFFVDQPKRWQAYLLDGTLVKNERIE